jgi:hypothetical protein
MDTMHMHTTLVASMHTEYELVVCILATLVEYESYAHTSGGSSIAGKGGGIPEAD